jgi:hypothetical protein
LRRAAVSPKAAWTITEFAQHWTAWGSAYGGSNTANGNAAVGSAVDERIEHQRQELVGQLERGTLSTRVGFAESSVNTLVEGEARTLKKNAACWPVRLVEYTLSRALPTAR